LTTHFNSQVHFNNGDMRPVTLKESVDDILDAARQEALALQTAQP